MRHFKHHSPLQSHKRHLLGVLLAASLFSVSLAGAAQDVSPPAASRDEKLVQSLKWYRKSAEQRAIYLQTYRQATDYVKQWVHTHRSKPHTWGVVIDIDETALDNSWYYQQTTSLPATEIVFSRDIDMEKKSTALPGAVNFCATVHALGGYVTLLSNRDGSYRDARGSALDASIDNLKAQHVYFDQVVLAPSHDVTDKTARFDAVMTGHYTKDAMVWDKTLPAHSVIAFLGDNIQDFPHLKQDRITQEPLDSQDYARFGRGYFLFPNPIYGSWVATPSH